LSSCFAGNVGGEACRCPATAALFGGFFMRADTTPAGEKPIAVFL